MQRLSAITHMWFGLFRVRSPLLTESLLFSFPVGTEMFHFPTFPPTALCVRGRGRRTLLRFLSRFPYSEIPGSKLVYQLPGLIAGYNVLHRLLVPRHPPIALSSLFATKDARVHCKFSTYAGGAAARRPTRATVPVRTEVSGCGQPKPQTNSGPRSRHPPDIFHSCLLRFSDSKNRPPYGHCPPSGACSPADRLGTRAHGPANLPMLLRKGDPPPLPVRLPSTTCLTPSHLRRLPPQGWSTGFGFTTFMITGCVQAWNFTAACCLSYSDSTFGSVADPSD